MIKKILLTLFVAFAVMLFYKVKNSTPAKKSAKELPEGKLSTQLMAYVIVGFLMLFSSVFFTLNWLDNRTLMTVRVINSQNLVSEYQIKKSSIKGRKFTTQDGRMIELGDNERMEILP